MYSTYNKRLLLKFIKIFQNNTYDSCVKKMFILMCYMILLINTIIHIITVLKKPIDLNSNSYA